MSNMEKAARMIRDLSEVDGETLGYAHVHNIAQALSDAGLLAPDLPEIKFEDDGGWQENEEKPEIFILAKNLPKGYVGIAFFDHDEKRLMIQVRPVAETRKFAHALLAAADHVEVEQ